MSPVRARAAAVLCCLGVLLLSGCGVFSRGVYEMPLPGGADVGDHPMTITAEFDDVLDLVPQSSVKVDNVAVGRVSDIRVQDNGRSARVELTIRGDVELPAGTTARLKQTSLLGEKYVALVRPSAPAANTAPLASGASLGLAETSQAAEVEQVLGALSLVLNGGGIGQFQEISRELQQVSAGRPQEIKAFLTQLETFVAGVDSRSEAITAALDGLADLSRTLDADKDKIVRALDGLSPGMQVLVDQRQQLVAMLRALDRLSTVTVATLKESQKDIVADLEALEPILAQLAKSGSDLPRSLQILLTYPFPDSVLGAIEGDYLNIFVTTNFRTVPADCAAIACAWPQVAGALEGGPPVPVAQDETTSPAQPAQPAQPGQPGARSTDGPAPTLLPPTSSATPGLPSATVPVPTGEPSTAPADPGGPPTDAAPGAPATEGDGS
ncbi:MCE family protein [Nocardioides pantholopis]|uniref:MCE family protein n=1 Tax=Nocardioides pantholopis TaxID=2483798 RepID=UPI000F077BE4|nr:MCE family protein [Nocardioides pantholopis]